MKYQTKSKDIEFTLTVSNLVFLAISQMDVRHLEIIKKVYIARELKSEDLADRLARELDINSSMMMKDLDMLSSARILHYSKNSSNAIELTDTGKLIALEIMREV